MSKGNNIPANMLSSEFFSDTYVVYEWLRTNAPVYMIDQIKTWFISRHSDAVKILDDNVNFSVENLPIGENWAPEVQAAMRTLFVDDPDHARLRGVVSGFFMPAAVKKRESEISKIISLAIERIVESGKTKIDVQKEFAYSVPIDVLSMLMGLPKEDFSLFHEWAPKLNEALLPIQTAEQQQAGAEAAIAVRDYLHELIRCQRAERLGGETILSLLIEGVRSGVMSEDEMLPQAVQLYIGGHETTLQLIGLTLHALFTHPTELDKVKADPTLALKAVEETVRWDGVSHGIVRRVASDYRLHGVTMKANDMVFVGNASANRDPLVFEDPDRFSIERRGRAAHLGFGRGIRYCLGQNVAKLEAKLAVAAFIQAFPNARLSEGFVPQYGQNLMMRGHTTLPFELY